MASASACSGKLRVHERTRSSFDADELRRLLVSFPDAVDGFDRPIVEQLALVEACDLFLSPHTGFGMAALAVATPWLTISRARGPSTSSTVCRSTRSCPTRRDSGASRPTTRPGCSQATRTTRARERQA
jgi:hypothetical protein